MPSSPRRWRVTACWPVPTWRGSGRCWPRPRCRWWRRVACRAPEDLAAPGPARGVGPHAGRRDRGQGDRGGALQRGGGVGRVRSVRLIPCLDVTGGRVVKGVRFVDLTDEGDPVELAARYDAEGADEVTFLDITASSDGRDTMVSTRGTHRRAGLHPLDGRRWCAGGGGRTPPAAGRGGQGRGEHRRGGATGAGAARSQTSSVVSAPWWRSTPRARADGAGWEVYTHGGRTPTGQRRRGVGRRVRRQRGRRDPAHVDGPRRDARRLRPGADPGGRRRRGDPRGGVRAGWAGCRTWWTAPLDGGADAVLAASIFHRREFTIGEAKAYMAARGVIVRPA